MDKDIKFIAMILTAFFLSSMATVWYDMGMTHELERQKIEFLAKGCSDE